MKKIIIILLGILCSCSVDEVYSDKINHSSEEIIDDLEYNGYMILAESPYQLKPIRYDKNANGYEYEYTKLNDGKYDKELVRDYTCNFIDESATENIGFNLFLEGLYDDVLITFYGDNIIEYHMNDSSYVYAKDKYEYVRHVDELGACITLLNGEYDSSYNKCNKKQEEEARKSRDEFYNFLKKYGYTIAEFSALRKDFNDLYKDKIIDSVNSDYKKNDKGDSLTENLFNLYFNDSNIYLHYDDEDLAVFVYYGYPEIKKYFGYSLENDRLVFQELDSDNKAFMFADSSDDFNTLYVLENGELIVSFPYDTVFLGTEEYKEYDSDSLSKAWKLNNSRIEMLKIISEEQYSIFDLVKFIKNTYKDKKQQ